MKRRVRWGSVVVLVLGSCVAASRGAWSQEVAPKILVAPPPGLQKLAQDLAAATAELARAVISNPAPTQLDRELVNDVRELAVAAAEFRDILRRDPEPYLLRRSYAGIDHAWHHIQL